MAHTLPRPTTTDPAGEAQYRRMLSAATWEALQLLRDRLLDAALSGDRISATCLPLVCAELDDRPEGQAAALRRRLAQRAGARQVARARRRYGWWQLVERTSGGDWVRQHLHQTPEQAWDTYRSLACRPMYGPHTGRRLILTTTEA